MMRIIKKRYISVLILAGALLLAGCFHGLHEEWPLPPGNSNEENQDNGNDKMAGCLAFSSVWEQAADASTLVNSLTVSLSGAEVSETKRFAGFSEMSGYLRELPVGDYDLLATVNMSESQGFTLTGMPATKAAWDKGGISVSFRDSAKSLGQAWFGVGHAGIKKKDTCQVVFNMQRLLPVFRLNIANMPAGASVLLRFSNIARKIELTTADASGRYGVPGSDCFASFALEPFRVDANGTLNVESVLPPTATGRDRCVLTIITTTGETVSTDNADIPRLDGGITYDLDLNYNTMLPDMHIGYGSISNWQEGWVIPGESVNPE